jgi:NAD(P)-dependent dehydrogenase (short-subunit alcohol dehydrogenase family)
VVSAVRPSERPDLRSTDLTGSTAFVTGAASGIGRASARLLTAAGARVAVADRDAEGARVLADELGASAVPIALDVADRAAIEPALAAAEAQLGVADILVNSAGIGACTPFWEADPDEFEYVLRVNLTGTFLVARAFTRRLLPSGRPGAIVNIASTNAFIPATGLSAYCASKGGVAMFTRVAAMELGTRGIRVNAVAPGSTLTGMTTMAFSQPAMQAGFLRHTPMGRFGEPDDIAQAVLYLASPLAAWVTGHLLVVDGGQSLRGLPLYLENLIA